MSCEGTARAINVLCCFGLYAGLYVGSALGGPWALIAPLLGFGLGLVGDKKLMRNYSCHGVNDEVGKLEPAPEIEVREANDRQRVNPRASEN